MSITTVVAMLLFIATFYAAFKPSSAYSWIQYPDPEIKIAYPNTKSVTMRWEWTLSKNSQQTEVFSQIEIKRYKEGTKDTTEKTIATYFAINNGIETDHSSFKLSVQNEVAGGSNGYAVFTIGNVASQGNNKDGSNVDAMSGNYTYSCHISLAIEITDPGPKSTTLIVYTIPSITVAPQSQYITSNRRVTLRCRADGKPVPVINWNVTKVSGHGMTSFRTELIIELFRKEDTGVYKCTAKNLAGNASVVALLQFTKCSSGCSLDGELAIEMTQLNYTSEYGNPNTAKYRSLKYTIEKACLLLYSKQSNQLVYSCLVQSFMKDPQSTGSGSAIAQLKITFPNDTSCSKARTPMLDALKSGTFAGQAVRSSLLFTQLPKVVPHGVTAQAKTSQTILVKWQISFGDPCSPGGFKIVFTTAPGESGQDVFVSGFHCTSYTLTNLAKGTDYYISVKVYNEKGDGPPSAVIKERTLEDCETEKTFSYVSLAFNLALIAIVIALLFYIHHLRSLRNRIKDSEDKSKRNPTTVNLPDQSVNENTSEVSQGGIPTSGNAIDTSPEYEAVGEIIQQLQDSPPHLDHNDAKKKRIENTEELSSS